MHRGSTKKSKKTKEKSKEKVNSVNNSHYVTVDNNKNHKNKVGEVHDKRKRVSNGKIEPTKNDKPVRRSSLPNNGKDIVLEKPPSPVRLKVKKRRDANVIDGLSKIEAKNRKTKAPVIESKPAPLPPPSAQSPIPPRLERSASAASFLYRSRRKNTDTIIGEDLETIPDEDGLPDSPLTRKPSFSRRLEKIATSFETLRSGLRRTLSFNRDLQQKRPPSSTNSVASSKLSCRWSASLQSLQEIDTHVSYNDLSFVNYDALNELEPKPKPDRSKHALCRFCSDRIERFRHSDGVGLVLKSCVCGRSGCINSIQSDPMWVTKVNPDALFCCCAMQPSYFTRSNSLYVQRTKNILPQDTDISYGAINRRLISGFTAKDVDQTTQDQTQEIKQSENNVSKQEGGDPDDDDQVRSRSLTHLDSLDPAMLVKQASTTGGTTKLNGDAALKDSRSEPDCAAGLNEQRLLYVPDSTGCHSRTSPERGGGGAVSPAANYYQPPSQRRQKLARSQVSSSEYFTVSFEIGDCGSGIGLNQSREEFVPAVKGVTLFESLSLACERYNIDLNQCVVLEGPVSAASYSLPYNTDTDWLAGKHLRIVPKEVFKKSPNQNHVPLHKTFSANYRGRHSKFFSASTEDPSVILEAERGKGRQRWSGFFTNNKDTKIEQLTELLNGFARSGVPGSPNEPRRAIPSEPETALSALEEHWQDFVDCTGMSESEKQFQTALWELLTTEAAYIKTLRVVTDLFLACLENLQQCGILTDIDKGKLFSNVQDIYTCNLDFWSSYLYPMLKQARETRSPMRCEYFLDGFLRFDEVFRPYERFCAEQSICQHYCREVNAQNELFTVYLAWCETQKECNRLRLADILVRPMQRFTKYSLLLQAARKHATDQRDWEGLDATVRAVDEFVAKVNARLRQRQENERLNGIMARIDSYEAVESKDEDLERLVKKYSNLDLSIPMAGCSANKQRNLLMEGDLKFRDHSGKVDAHCFLLTDMFLVCKPSTKRSGSSMKIVRQPYLSDRLHVKELTRDSPTIACVYLNEYGMAVAAFTLQCTEAKVLKSWSDCLKKASHMYTQCKQQHPWQSQHGVQHGGQYVHMSDQWGGSNEFTTDLSLSCDLDYDSHAGPCLAGGVVPTSQASAGGIGVMTGRSPLAGSSRGSRVSSLAHSHSGSVEMNESMSSLNPTSRNVSIEQDLRTTSLSSDEGIPPLSHEHSPKEPAKPSCAGAKSPTIKRPGNKVPTPNTLSVQPFSSLGQSLPNLTINSGALSLQPLVSPHTLRVPPGAPSGSANLLSPHHRGTSYPPPSPTRGSLRRGFAFSATHKNPPLIKTRHITSQHSVQSMAAPVAPPPGGHQSLPATATNTPHWTSPSTLSRDVPTPPAAPSINNYMAENDFCESPMRCFTTGDLLDILKNDNRIHSAFKRFSIDFDSLLFMEANRQEISKRDDSEQIVISKSLCDEKSLPNGPKTEQ